MRTLSTQCNDIFRLQDKLNEEIVPNWKMVKHPYLRASWVECAELMDWIGMKWWKKQEIDKPQAVIELIDILHFVVSQLIIEGFTSAYMFKAVKDINLSTAPLPDVDTEEGKEQLLKMVENIALYSLRKAPAQTLSALLMCFKILEVSMDDIHIIYIGKCCLNDFRQVYGYKDGTYTKIWNQQEGKEDNVFLEEAIEHTKSRTDFDELDTEDIQDCIWGILEAEYVANVD